MLFKGYGVFTKCALSKKSPNLWTDLNLSVVSLSACHPSAHIGRWLSNISPHEDQDDEEEEDEGKSVHHLGQEVPPGDDLGGGGAHGDRSLRVRGGVSPGRDHVWGDLAYQGNIREAEEGRQGPDHGGEHQGRRVGPHHQVREAEGEDELQHGEHHQPRVEGDHQGQGASRRRQHEPETDGDT